MKTRFDHSLSYVCHGIYTFQVVVNLGSKWRIGNGRNISIWRDPWLKGRNNVMVKSPIGPGMEHLKVGDLFDNTSGEWNRSLQYSMYKRPIYL